MSKVAEMGSGFVNVAVALLGVSGSSGSEEVDLSLFLIAAIASVFDFRGARFEDDEAAVVSEGCCGLLMSGRDDL
jgi:hypothetical protein